MGESLATGTHAYCQFRDHDHKRRLVAGFVSDGLRRGHRVAYYSRDGDAALLTSELGGVSVGELIAERHLVVGSAERTYLAGGGFDGPATVASFAEFAERTVADGYSGLSVYTDNGWMAAALPDPIAWLQYELRMSRMVPDYPVIQFCGFDASDQALPLGAIDAVHAVNAGDATQRPANFRLTRVGDDFAMIGELDSSTLNDLTAVLAAAAPLIYGQRLSLTGVTFADAASAAALSAYIDDARPVLTGVSPALTKVWQLLGM